MADHTPQTRLELGPVTVLFGDKNGKYPDGNQVMVTGSDTRVIFDTPLSSGRLRPELQGADLILLGHVHEDHTAGVALFPDVPLYAPAQDVEAVRSVEGLMRHYGYSEPVLRLMRTKVRKEFNFEPRPNAIGYEDGHVWELGGVSVRALHMPGHTAGHSVLWVEPDGIAFIGDIDLSGFGPYYGDACSSLPEFRDTLRRMEGLEAAAWITFHHKGVITERETYLRLLRAFAAKIDERERAILAVMGPSGKSFEQLAARRYLFPEGYDDVFTDDAERISLTEHLLDMQARGKVQLQDGVYSKLA